jgi:hypothetical protein
VVAVALTAAVVAGGASCSKDDGDGGSVEAFCALLGPTAGFADLAKDFDPTDVDRALEQLGSMRVELDRLRAAAPGEVRDHIDTEADYIAELTAALQAVDPDDAPAAAKAVNDLASDAAKATVASSELQRFETANCGAATTVATTETG